MIKVVSARAQAQKWAVLVTQGGDPLARKVEKRNALTVLELSHIFEEVHIGLALKRRSQQAKRS